MIAVRYLFALALGYALLGCVVVAATPFTTYLLVTRGGEELARRWHRLGAAWGDYKRAVWGWARA